MTESLDVIALISGGKDSFFSVLHCKQNGHNVIALGNLYPASAPPHPDREHVSNHDSDGDDERDLNSFMYQTVGHTVIPLYEQALGIPLYRQPIVGTAVETGTSYGYAEKVHSDEAPSKVGEEPRVQLSQHREEDETESLVPLLRRIMAKHPTATALSTGAILSTYQRTRIESVALRLGLIPFAYLWKYPILPPVTQISLLEDMQVVGLDARIVKVASGGLDESFLWGNVASEHGLRRVERSMKKFGTDGDGAVLGEGGEFETLVIDGPATLFKGRIEVQDKDRKIVRESGGSAWLQILKATVVMKEGEEGLAKECRIPDLLDPEFKRILSSLDSGESNLKMPLLRESQQHGLGPRFLYKSSSLPSSQEKTLRWSISINEDTSKMADAIQSTLHRFHLLPSDIISSVIILRSMQDFARVNKIYGSLFTKPNPPSRVTISCGDLLPEDVNVMIHLKAHNEAKSSPARKTLHVQSRSYWAPANIGPYSQAISIPLSNPEDPDKNIWAVSVAGQIPLIPHLMRLPLREGNDAEPGTHDFAVRNFRFQTVLALQHLWRIGEEMSVSWWTGVVAYLPRGSLDAIAEKAAVAGRVWAEAHCRKEDEDDSESEDMRDLWEEKYYAGMEIRGGSRVRRPLPDWDVVQSCDGESAIPPFFAVEVEELPRESGVEWHAHLGVVNGPVKLHSQSTDQGWSLHECMFGDQKHSVVMIDYSDDISELKQRLEMALKGKVVGESLISMDDVHTWYLDVSINGMWEVLTSGGKVPCRSIWDIHDRRLGCVCLFESFL